ncbi:MAG: hypothetical protein M1822_003331 [Bathelium mastoideum]|nr:MAG: hypothetical protein M1822_003331 [Bathelium mastoideum]
MSTPPSMRGSTPSLPPPSPLASAIIPGGDEHHDTDAAETPLITVDPLADVPPLTTCLATTSDDKLAALKLVADSVAQQRQFASRVLIFHPLNLAVFAVILGIVAQLVFKYRSSGDAGWFGADAALVGTTWAGVAMAALVGVRIVTGKYLDEAETIKWDFVGGMPTENANGGVVQNGSHVRNRSGSGPNAKDVLISKFGNEVIGALVLEWVVGEGKMRRKKVGRGSIRAWTVKLRYRGKGVGTGLLEEAAKLVEERGGDGIEFNEEHANSKRFLWQVYNSAFETREQKGRDLLDSIVDARTPQTKRR